jgi:hypothetical protein
MTAPTYQDVGRYYVASGLTHALTMPASIAADELLIAIVANDSTTLSAMAELGWCLVDSASANGTADTVRVFSKRASGSEGATANLILPTSEAVASHIYRISGADYDIEVATSEAVATGNTIVMPSLSPSWGSADCIWIEAVVAVGMTGISSMSSGYSAGIYDGASAAANVALISAYRTATTGTESPGNVTTTGTSGANYASIVIAARETVASGSSNTGIILGSLGQTGIGQF